MVVDGQGIADGFPALVNQGYVNEKGAKDDMDWAVMEQEEVHDQKNYADELDICPIDILLCYWKSATEKLMLRITGLNGISEDVVEADDVKFDYPDTLALYLLGTSIGVKKAREYRNL